MIKTIEISGQTLIAGLKYLTAPKDVLIFKSSRIRESNPPLSIHEYYGVCSTKGLDALAAARQELHALKFGR